MTSDVLEEAAQEVSAELAVGGPATLGGEPVRSMVALSPHGSDQVAVWHVNLVGEACGAWILDSASPEDALAILQLCDRRAVIEDGSSSARLILHLAKTAGIEIAGSQVSERLARLDDLLSATSTARREHSAAVTEYGEQAGKNLARLVWRSEVPETVAALRALPIGGWAGAGEAPDAFVLSRLTSKAIALWTETEAARVRREYLREQFGPAQVLPPVWRDAALAAFAKPFDLRQSPPRRNS